MAEMDEKGRRAARAVAQWYLGDPDWGTEIVKAYLNPEQTMEALRAEMEET